jgi:hypothetical protein
MIDLSDEELNLIILSMVYLRRYLREEKEDYKAIALKMTRDSYDLEAKLVKYLDSFRRVENASH